MKVTNIQLTAETINLFEEFHSLYRGYAMAKESLSSAESDMKESKSDWISHTPEFDEAPGGAGISIVNEDGEMVAKFTKARAVNTLEKREYISAVLRAAGADEQTCTTVTGLLATTDLLDELTISATLAKKQHPSEYAAALTTEAAGARTVKFL